MAKERILVTAHAHPDFSLGGGEIAAYNLFKAYRENKNIEEAWFLGRADRGNGANGTISLRRENEYLWEQGIQDWFKFKASHQESLTVVHSHHFMHLGLEHFRIIKQVDPTIKLLMTLHEYQAICAHSGQMVKTGAFRLCSRESFDECRNCFPERTAQDFWLRKHFIKSHFDLVDHFISPSEFLRQRYIDWGVSPDRITVIENGQATEEPLPPRALAEGEARNRFGYFGQINHFKGLDVILSALTHMKKSERKKIVLEVHGANLEAQPQWFQEKINTLVDPLIHQGVVQWVGPYQPNEVRKRMAGIDWVVVPSIWWENSPMVIQEAFVNGRPLLVSDIGGMAEKVRHGIDGLHVASGNRAEWARALLKAAEPSVWNLAVANIQTPLSYGNCGNDHLSLLDRVLR